MLSLGLIRRVRVSEESPFRHGCYPDPAQSASVCELDRHRVQPQRKRHGITMVIGREDRRII